MFGIDVFSYCIAPALIIILAALSARLGGARDARTFALVGVFSLAAYALRLLLPDLYVDGVYYHGHDQLRQAANSWNFDWSRPLGDYHYWTDGLTAILVERSIRGLNSAAHLWGALLVPAVFGLGVAWFGKRTGWIAAWLIALWPLPLLFSQSTNDTMPMAVLLTFAVLSLTHARQRGGLLAAHGAMLCLAGLVALKAEAVLMTPLLFLVIWRTGADHQEARGGDRLQRWGLTSFLFVALCWFAWLFPWHDLGVLLAKATRFEENHEIMRLRFLISYPALSLFLTLPFYPPSLPVMWFAWKTHRSERNRYTRLAVVWVLMVIGIYLFQNGGLEGLRHMIVAVPAIALLVGHGIARWPARRWRHPLVLFTLVYEAFVVGVFIFMSTNQTRVMVEELQTYEPPESCRLVEITYRQPSAYRLHRGDHFLRGLYPDRPGVHTMFVGTLIGEPVGTILLQQVHEQWVHARLLGWTERLFAYHLPDTPRDFFLLKRFPQLLETRPDWVVSRMPEQGPDLGRVESLRNPRPPRLEGCLLFLKGPMMIGQQRYREFERRFGKRWPMYDPVTREELLEFSENQGMSELIDIVYTVHPWPDSPHFVTLSLRPDWRERLEAFKESWLKILRLREETPEGGAQ